MLDAHFFYWSFLFARQLGVTQVALFPSVIRLSFSCPSPGRGGFGPSVIADPATWSTSCAHPHESVALGNRVQRPCTASGNTIFASAALSLWLVFPLSIARISTWRLHRRPVALPLRNALRLHARCSSIGHSALRLSHDTRGQLGPLPFATHAFFVLPRQPMSPGAFTSTRHATPPFTRQLLFRSGTLATLALASYRHSPCGPLSQRSHLLVLT